MLHSATGCRGEEEDGDKVSREVVSAVGWFCHIVEAAPLCTEGCGSARMPVRHAAPPTAASIPLQDRISVNSGSSVELPEEPIQLLKGRVDRGHNRRTGRESGEESVQQTVWK